jgi:hypothetical protein
VGALFKAYVASLRAAGKRSADFAEGILDAAAAAIGSSRPAGEVTPGEIVPHLATVHDRGAKVQAVIIRVYMRAAFAYGLKAEHDYTRQDAGARWGLTSNPITAKAARPSVGRRRVLLGLLQKHRCATPEPAARHRGAKSSSWCQHRIRPAHRRAHARRGMTIHATVSPTAESTVVESSGSPKG